MSNKQPTFQILYFASAASFTRKASESLPAPLPVHKLFDVLEERYPGMKDKVLVSCAVSVELDYVQLEDDGTDGRVIQAGEEVAIIPPVSSG